VGGGDGNAAVGADCVVGGGHNNLAGATGASVGGGEHNKAEGFRSHVNKQIIRAVYVV
jgi:hypothetical protein